MNLSARNQLHGKVKSVKTDGLMAEVTIDVGGQDLVAVITASSAERLDLKPGADVSAVIKSTEVMIGT